LAASPCGSSGLKRRPSPSAAPNTAPRGTTSRRAAA
jgi:hypothetical protein